MFCASFAQGCPGKERCILIMYNIQRFKKETAMFYATCERCTKHMYNLQRCQEYIDLQSVSCLDCTGSRGVMDLGISWISFKFILGWVDAASKLTWLRFYWHKMLSNKIIHPKVVPFTWIACAQGNVWHGYLASECCPDERKWSWSSRIRWSKPEQGWSKLHRGWNFPGRSIK